MTFTYNGRTLDLLDHPHNATSANERAVEIPIALQWITEHGLDLEVGNVLRYYGLRHHRVVDRWELAAGVENIDIFDIEPAGSVVAISTLEHVRWDEPSREPDGAIRALHHLRRISERLLVTVPMGYHPHLDEHLLNLTDVTNAYTMVRTVDGWLQTPEPRWAPYGPWATSVWIGEWL